MTTSGSSGGKPVATLNDVSEAHLAEARRLAARREVDAVNYLCDLVTKCELGDAASFIEEVVRGRADPRSWGRTDVLTVPFLQVADLLQRALSDTMSSLRDVAGVRWARLNPSASAWPDWFAGAPGVFTRSQPYWQTSPHGTTTVVVSAADELEYFEHALVGARRWLASRIAALVKGSVLPETTEELAVALRVAGPVSRDAEIALQALRREASLGDAAAGVPGFRGPDDWFA